MDEDKIAEEPRTLTELELSIAAGGDESPTW
jgi:hypothetical protein